MRILLTFLISKVSWMLANITSESSHCFQKGNRNSGRRLCIMVCPSFWKDYYMLIYTHCWELMNSVGSHGSLSLPFVMKVMVCDFVSDSHEVMTALIVVLPLIVILEISLQLHWSLLKPLLLLQHSECESMILLLFMYILCFADLQSSVRVEQKYTLHEWSLSEDWG